MTHDEPFGAGIDRRLHRLALAMDKLRKIARDCPACLGLGDRREQLQCFGMTDDERVTAVGNGGDRRRAALKVPQVNETPLGSAVLRTPCPACRDIREVLDILEDRV